MRLTHLWGPTLLIGLALLLTIAGSTTSAHAGPDSTTIWASADTYVESASPDSPRGRTAALYQNHWTATYYTYLKFDLAPIAAWDQIESVVAHMYYWDLASESHDATDDHYYELLGMSDDSWSEASVTWNTRPADGWQSNPVQSRYSENFLATQSDGTLLSWDATGAYNSFGTDNETLSLAVWRNPDAYTGTSYGGWALYYSKEWDTGQYTPYLEITGAVTAPSADDSPEPATWVLLVATAAFGALRRRRD